LVVLKSLAKAPEDRYQTAEEFQSAWREAFFGGDERETRFITRPAPAVPPMDPKDLTRVESSLTRVLGPIARNLVAKAAARHHTIDELSRALALEIPDEADRAAFLKACGVTSGSHKTPSASQKASGVAKQIDEKTFLAARKALAVSLGPIAAMLVARAAKKVHSAEELRDVLASEIDDEKDRKAFLAAFSVD
jgi:eukaryotic-like serine/threonine-protein kinase